MEHSNLEYVEIYTQESIWDSGYKTTFIVHVKVFYTGGGFDDFFNHMFRIEPE